MGSACACQAEDRQTHIQISRHMQASDKAQQKMKKLVLLGSGSSGKSTFFQQLSCIYDNGFKEKDLVNCRQILRQNAVAAVLKLLCEAKKFYEENPEECSHFKVDLENEQTMAAMKLCFDCRNHIFEDVSGQPAVDEMKALGMSMYCIEIPIYFFCEIACFQAMQLVIYGICLRFEQHMHIVVTHFRFQITWTIFLTK